MSEPVDSKKIERENEITSLKEQLTALEKRVSVHDNILVGRPKKSIPSYFIYQKEPKDLIIPLVSWGLGLSKMVTGNQLENECIEVPVETLESKKAKIIKAIEENSNETNFLKTIDDLTNLSGYTTTDVLETIEDSSGFVQNKLGQYTTRKLYEKFAPWYIKFLHSMKNRID